MIKPSNNTSATITEMIAFTTKAAGPSMRNVSKADAIGKAKTCLPPVLRSLLIGCEPRQVLTRRQLEAQTAAVRMRRKLPYLIHLREIFCPYRVEDISSQMVLVPSGDRKSESCHPRRSPFGAGKMASRSSQPQGPRPVTRQVKECCPINRKNARRRIPVPVLPVVDLHSAYDFATSKFPPLVVNEECFIFRNNIVVMSRCTAHR